MGAESPAPIRNRAAVTPVDSIESSGLLEIDPSSTVADAEDGLNAATASATSDTSEEFRRQWNEQLFKWQSRAAILSHILSLLGALLVFFWVQELGGLAWKKGHSKQVFNWHPLLMVLAFLFMTVAALSFRTPYLSTANYSRSTIKLVHGSAWSVAALFATMALIAVFRSHNDGVSGYIANLYSLHSWLGLGVVGLYLCQFLAGFFTFAWPLPFITPVRKAQIMTLHSFLGPFLYTAVAATILLGIQEKEGFVKCGYDVKKADLFPLSHFFLIPTPCLISHALGIVVFATALSTSFALHAFKR